MHVTQIRKGGRYRSPQGWIYLVEHIADTQVHYEIVSGPDDLRGRRGQTHVTQFAGRMSDFADRHPTPKHRQAGQSQLD